jgi:hypothetical protein
MFARNVGILIGPIAGELLSRVERTIVANMKIIFCVGGALANPAEQFPSTIGKVHFFIDFPYALPAMIAGAIGLSTTIAAALYLKEVRCQLNRLCCESC